MSGQRMLVTGGSGFLGAALCPLAAAMLELARLRGARRVLGSDMDQTGERNGDG